jgi:hypothetical protein
MAMVNVHPEELTDIIGDLLEGRNIAPANMYEKYVVDVKKDGNTLLVEVDDGSSYRIAVERA